MNARHGGRAALLVAIGWSSLGCVPACAQSVTVYETTADQKELLVRKQLTFSPVLPAARINLRVDPAVRLQTMDGFGASLTDSSASLIAPLPAAERVAIMHELFSPDGPLGLTLLRQPIGASDFSSHGDYSYDDPAGGKPDPGLTQFSVKLDEAQLFPLLREAQHLNPQLHVMILPWSAPAWMKSNGSMKAGMLLDRYLEPYARYLARTVEAYHAEGVPVWAMALQNEPLNENPGYPTQRMLPAQEARLAAALQPLLRGAGRSPVLMGYEHNWSNVEYPAELLRAAPGLFAGISFHCYGGSESAQAAFLRDHPHTSLWFTECSGTHRSSFAESFLWQARHLLLGAPLNGARSVMLWNLVLDPHGNPHNGGCEDCTPLLTLERHGAAVTWHRTEAYYLLAHAAPFVHPGAVRVGVTVTGSADLLAEAFQNADGTLVVIALNTAQSPAELALGSDKAGLAYTMPARSLATFQWGAAVPVVRLGTYRLIVGDKAIAAERGASSLSLQSRSGDAAQLWSLASLPSGRFEIRSVTTAQALATSAQGTLTALTLDGAHTAALTLIVDDDGFCIALPGKRTCASFVADMALAGNVRMMPEAAPSGAGIDN